jgi:hypothetical protein
MKDWRNSSPGTYAYLGGSHTQPLPTPESDYPNDIPAGRVGIQTKLSSEQEGTVVPQPPDSIRVQVRSVRLPSWTDGLRTRPREYLSMNLISINHSINRVPKVNRASTRRHGPSGKHVAFPTERNPSKSVCRLPSAWTILTIRRIVSTFSFRFTPWAASHSSDSRRKTVSDTCARKRRQVRQDGTQPDSQTRV